PGPDRGLAPLRGWMGHRGLLPWRCDPGAWPFAPRAADLSGGDERGHPDRPPDPGTRMKPLSRWLPILDWGRRYDLATFGADLLAAVIVTIMLIPQSLAYAMLAGLPRSEERRVA